VSRSNPERTNSAGSSIVRSRYERASNAALGPTRGCRAWRPALRRRVEHLCVLSELCVDRWLPLLNHHVQLLHVPRSSFVVLGPSVVPGRPWSLVVFGPWFYLSRLRVRRTELTPRTTRQGTTKDDGRTGCRGQKDQGQRATRKKNCFSPLSRPSRLVESCLKG